MNEQITLDLTTVKRKWLDDALAFLPPMIPFMGRFTSDDLHIILPKPDHQNYYGVLCTQLKRAGLIKPVGFKTSTRKERNGGTVRVWEAAV